jgi:AraC-like DNA-binding protein
MAPPQSLMHLSTQLKVRLMWAERHRWPASRSIFQDDINGYCLWLVESGALHVASANNQYNVPARNAMFWPRHEARRIFTQGPAQWMTIGLHVTLFDNVDILRNLKAPYLWKLTAEQSDLLHALMNHIIKTRESASSAADLLTDGLCRALVGVLWLELGGEITGATENAMPVWLQKVLLHARQHPETSVSQLSDIAAFSPAQFRRSFARWMKVSPQEYLIRQRFERARDLLENTEQSVSAIAEQLHFASATHFGRAWKKQYGTTPLRYRRSAKQSL